MSEQRQATVKVLMVCLGNICRSPTAQGVLERMLADEGLQDRVWVDSAGTGDYHIGKAPDPRARMAAGERGYEIDDLRARQVTAGDFERFDYVLAMDEMNYMNLQDICPLDRRDRLAMLLDFSGFGVREVPDPYFGGEQGFDHVLDLVEDACLGLVADIRRRLDARG